MIWGSHCLKMWSSTQATRALSSSESQLYAQTKGAAQRLGMMSLMSDFGVGVSATIHTDASAAIGIVQSRSGQAQTPERTLSMGARPSEA